MKSIHVADQAPPFLDSNILIYSRADDSRSTEAARLIENPFTISVQILNQFAVVMRRKLGFEWDRIEGAVADVVQLASSIHPVSLDLHIAGMRIAERYGLQLYDSVVVAAALRAQCSTLFSEDMHHGLIVEDRLTIVNPFV